MRFTDSLKILFVLILLSFFAACSDDNGDDNPTGPDDDGNEPPTLNVQQVPVPQAMQTAANNGDPGATQAMAYIQIANMLPSYAQLLNPPQGSGKLPSTSAVNGEWTWTQDGATFTLTSTETATGFEMTLTVDGTYNGQTYNGGILMEASGTKDGSSGELYFYDPGSGVAELTFNWETLADGTYHLTINTSDAAVELYYYSDGSGSLDVNMQNAGSWDIDWASDGSGTWMQYDASGSLIDSGSWG